MEVSGVIREFGLGTNLEYQRIGSGHINETYLVGPANGTMGVLQRINTDIFQDPEGLMRNLQVITEHLRSTEYPFKCFEIIPTPAGGLFVRNDTEFWRMITWLEGKEASLYPGEKDKARKIGAGYGNFLKYLNELKPDRILDTIPGFHDPERRFNQLLESIDSADRKRIRASQSLVDHALAFSTIPVEYAERNKFVPLRITHGDAKDSNILIDETGNVKGIIDLDTVMPGYIMNDFGDMVRSMCNTSTEDSKDLAAVKLDIENFTGISGGFLTSMNSILNQEELDSLLIGVRSILFEQYLRFLSDYLSNDVYYKTDYPDHNLVRARVHLKLLLDFQSKEEQLIEILNRVLPEI